MPVLYDARGNEIRSSFADLLGGETLTDTRDSDAVLGALNAEVVMDLMGTQSVTIDVRTAAGALTYVCESTIDGTNYFPTPLFALTQVLGAAASYETYVVDPVVATTAASRYTVQVAGFRRVRIRVSAYTSGNITVAMRGTAALLHIYGKKQPSTLHVTATAAANTIATATLPAAGANLFHYITHIHLMRNATAALAGTATLIHTSTNLPGSPAWSVGNAMVAGGTQLDLEYSPTTPLKSLVPNTNTTIVMPAAGAAVLNRINVSYYIGS